MASRCRLQLLLDLREPRRLKEIRLSSDRSWAWAHDARAITRQAVRHHLRALEEVGAVTSKRRFGDETFVVDPYGLHGVLEDLMALAAELDLPARAREAQLVVLNGERRGEIHPIAPRGDEPWAVGSRADVALPLGNAPGVLPLHFTLEATASGAHVVCAVEGAVTYLNGRPLEPRETPLVSGDTLSVGETVFLYRRADSVGPPAPLAPVPVGR